MPLPTETLESLGLLIRAGKLDQALGLLESLQQAHPGDASLALKLADLYARAGKAAEAVKSYREVARRLIGESLLAQAAAVLGNLLRVSPGLVEDRIELAEVHRGLGAQEECDRQYAHVARQLERESKIDRYLSFFRLRLDEKPEEAAARRLRLAALCRALKKNAEALSLLREAFLALIASGRKAEAVRVGLALYESAPGSGGADVLRAVASMRFDAPDARDAWPPVKDFLARRRDDPVALALFADGFRVSGDTANQVRTLKTMAGLFARTGQHEILAKTWQAIAALTPDDVEAKRACEAMAQFAPKPAPPAAPPAPPEASALPLFALEPYDAGRDEPAAPPPDPSSLLPTTHVVDQLVEQRLPYPLARLWRSVPGVAPAARPAHLAACASAALRLLVAILLPDYLSGPADAEADAALSRLERPTAADLFGLLESLARALRDRRGAGFVPEALSWFFAADGAPSEAARCLAELASPEPKADPDALYGRLRDLLASLTWLAGYRLVRAVEAVKGPQGTWKGKIQLFAGWDDLPRPVPAEWSQELGEQAVYLLNPAANGVLEVSPLLRVARHRGVNQDRLFLFRAIPGLEGVELLHDDTGVTATMLALAESGPCAFREWLARRGTRPLRRSFSESTGSLAAAAVGSLSDLGKVLGDRFLVQAILGEGGMATVWSAFDRVLARQVALKIVKSEFAADWLLRERFRREVEVMRAMSHRHVMRLLDAGELKDGRMYLVMPVMRGGSLADRIKPGEAPDQQVLGWAIALLDALAYLHRQGVVHRDVKPSNFLLSESEVFVADFGISLREDDGAARLTSTLEQLGSRAYMAPEQHGRGEVTGKADVFSLAAILHQLLRGERGIPAAAGKGIEGPLGALIRRMGAQDPEERPTAAEALVELAGIVRGGR